MALDTSRVDISPHDILTWTPRQARILAVRPIRHLRWYVGGLLFLSTVINYIDRQTLSVLGPYLKTDYQWTNTDFAMVLIKRAYQTVGTDDLDAMRSTDE